MCLMNATEDLLDAGRVYFKINKETADIAYQVGNLPF